MVLSRQPVSRRGGAGDGARVPVASMVENIIGCKWSVRLLELCAGGYRRPSALLRACPGLSAKVMNERLRKMLGFGILQRKVFGDKPPVEVEYRLTPLGRRFLRILAEVRRLQRAVDQGALRTPASVPGQPGPAAGPDPTLLGNGARGGGSQTPRR